MFTDKKFEYFKGRHKEFINHKNIQVLLNLCINRDLSHSGLFHQFFEDYKKLNCGFSLKGSSVHKNFKK